MSWPERYLAQAAAWEKQAKCCPDGGKATKAHESLAIAGIYQKLADTGPDSPETGI